MNAAPTATRPAPEALEVLERLLCRECGVELLHHEPAHPDHGVCDMCLEAMLETREIGR